MMMKIKDLIDSENSYSVTRWALVVAIRTSVILAISSVIAYLVLKFLGKDVDANFIGEVGKLIAIIIGILSFLKGAQGFEPYKSPKNKITEEK